MKSSSQCAQSTFTGDNMTPIPGLLILAGINHSHLGWLTLYNENLVLVVIYLSHITFLFQFKNFCCLRMDAVMFLYCCSITFFCYVPQTAIITLVAEKDIVINFLDKEE